jgi:hypothetical protein
MKVQFLLHRKYCVSVTRTELFKDIFIVYCLNHTVLENVLYGEKGKCFYMLKAGGICSNYSAL